jgi:hypothetical protein
VKRHKHESSGQITRHETMISSKVSLSIFLTWGIAQNRNIAGSRNADMYFKQSSTCIKELVTMSFKHCTASTEFSSYFKSWGTKHKTGRMLIRWVKPKITLSHFKYCTYIYIIHEHNDYKGMFMVLKLRLYMEKKQTSSLLTYLLQISRGQNMRDLGISFMSSR